MKHILSMKLSKGIILILIVISFTSCTREYICQCTLSYSGVQPGLPEPKTHEFTIRDKKETAAKLCSDNSTLITENNITMKDTCRLY